MLESWSTAPVVVLRGSRDAPETLLVWRTTTCDPDGDHAPRTCPKLRIAPRYISMRWLSESSSSFRMTLFDAVDMSVRRGHDGVMLNLARLHLRFRTLCLYVFGSWSVNLEWKALVRRRRAAWAIQLHTYASIVRCMQRRSSRVPAWAFANISAWHVRQRTPRR